jgi:excisionase family DNA binding protein
MYNISTILNKQRDYLKSSDVAKLLNVNHSTVILWVKKKKLKPIKTPGGNFRFAKSEVERLLRSFRENSDIEKRKHPRFAVHFPVLISNQNATEKAEAVICDISNGGAGIEIAKSTECYRSIANNRTTPIKVFDLGSGFITQEIEAEVRHYRDIDDESAFIGLLLRQ